MSMSFKEMEEQYIQIIERFSKIELRQWKGDAATLELVKQAGELSKWVMMKEKYYAFAENEEVVMKHIENELADVMAQVIRIAYVYNVDLEKAYKEAREDEDAYLRSRGV